MTEKKYLRQQLDVLLALADRLLGERADAVARAERAEEQVRLYQTSPGNALKVAGLTWEEAQEAIRELHAWRAEGGKLERIREVLELRAQLAAQNTRFARLHQQHLTQMQALTLLQAAVERIVCLDLKRSDYGKQVPPSEETWRWFFDSLKRYALQQLQEARSKLQGT